MRNRCRARWGRPERTGRLVAAVLAVLTATLPVQGSASDADRPNIVLIIVDALRPDHLGCYGYEYPTSPAIDALAGQGIVFETAIAHAPWTKSSVATMLTSLYPYQHGVVAWKSLLPDSFVTLPEILEMHGYHTISVFNVLGVAGRFNLLQGFGQRSTAEQYRRNALKTTEDALAAIEAAGEPFFLMVHYYDVHSPYNPPRDLIPLVRGDPGVEMPVSPMAGQPAEGQGTQDWIEEQVLLYDGCIRYVDGTIGDFVDALRRMGVWDRTAVVLTADHGEAFWEHGTVSHGEQLYDEAIRVPLILTYGGLTTQPERVSDLVGHVDLLPTLLDLSGAEDDRHREGVSLLGLAGGDGRRRAEEVSVPGGGLLCECTSQRVPDTKCIRTPDWKIIAEPLTSLIELYDLRKDPGETMNLWGERPEIGDSLLAALMAIPGTSRGGWRIAFTGTAGSAAFEMNIACPSGARISSLEPTGKAKSITMEAAPDSASVVISTEPLNLSLVHLTTTPATAGLRFNLERAGRNPVKVAAVGRQSERPLGEAFILRPEDALGLPGGFVDGWSKGEAGVYIWWLPGDQVVSTRETTDLTPQERVRLKALGYLQ